MKNTGFFLTLILLLASCVQDKNSSQTEKEIKKPNILLVMVDDMGFTDTSPYGGEINTPTIEKLAKNGMMFTDFHTSVSCSPTRSMLLSGTDNHLAGLGNMGELLTPNQVGKPGYEGHLNNNVLSMAEVLKEAGYHTYMGGKWHLGHDMNSIPGARGFEKTLSLLNGGASHYDDMAGLTADEHIEYTLNGEKIDKLPEDFYSSRSFTDFLMKSIREQKDDKPFLAYLAFSAPHDPLHVPEPWMSKYQGVYDEGFEKLREDRIKKAKDLGLVSNDAKIPAMNHTAKAWNSLSKEEKEVESRYMEVYAGMVENVDYHMGRMMDFLSDIDELDNTIILFLSDNGSNPWDNSMYPGNGDGVYLSQFDNRLDNIGNPTSHTAYGIGWASAGSGPFDYFKMTAGEGGIRTPLIISGPNVSKGEVHRNFVYVTDIMPTLLEMAGVEHPDTYKGNKVLDMRGKSFSKILSGEEKTLYTKSEYIAGEMQNGKWIRQGNFKAVFIPKPYGPQEWKLYDLSVDPGETTDLSEQEPDLLKELIVEWEKYADEVGVVAM
ncbi:arylsulfatase [Lutimonas sp.]|uniref:arylsulfatase n=1 Tax=Lutimonas sp. TaxID=1872403 RepID=UPI003D9AC945